MTVLDSKTLIRDTLLALAALVFVSFGVGGVDSVVGTLAGGALALGNVLMLSRLVANLLTEDGRNAALIGMLMKSIVGLGVLLVLLTWLDAIGVMLGVGAGVAALSLRSFASVFTAPQES